MGRSFLYRTFVTRIVYNNRPHGNAEDITLVNRLKISQLVEGETLRGYERPTHRGHDDLDVGTIERNW